MVEVLEMFRDRVREISDYLRLLASIEQQLREGLPKVGERAITVRQLKIMYSAVYLQLYNLVEATVTRGLKEVCKAANDGCGGRVESWTEELRREWVRRVARTHSPDDGSDVRLKNTLRLCNVASKSRPLANWSIDIEGGGNIDDSKISRLAARIGCDLNLSVPVTAKLKRHVRDNHGPIALIRKLRNDLGHGDLSFSQCGEGNTVRELRDLTAITVSYLRKVLRAFVVYIEDCHYLAPEYRP